MKQKSSLALPALRGSFGDWVFYSCLMPVRLVADLVDYAHAIHTSRALSDLIQRQLEGARASKIAAYLGSTDDRFFNSLVLATYGGQPEWLEVDAFQAKSSSAMKATISSFAQEAIGFLYLNGNEKIFAIDGQHRLAGLKRALEDGLDIGDEQLPVIFVGHNKSAAGLRRTRRLFTTLNKTAVPVKRADIITLDEDDAMAITVRRLVETNPKFAHPKIAVTASTNLPLSFSSSLTQITNLYDVLRILLISDQKSRSPVNTRIINLRFNRPSDEKLDHYYKIAVDYFESLERAFPAIRAFFNASPETAISTRRRGETGGHLLFRPIGLELFTKVCVDYAKAHSITINDAVASLRNIPTELSAAPYESVIWDPIKGRVIASGKTLAFDLLRYMCRLPVNDRSLLVRYQKSRSQDLAAKNKLPAPFV